MNADAQFGKLSLFSSKAIEIDIDYAISAKNDEHFDKIKALKGFKELVDKNHIG